ncbi:YciI family protein [Dyadobacter psychrophilus]|uniref:Uncharacterized conserved protein n=1 Tax=Dyadobacter psychrophilus TaxID=651661 RepID=A0A1T5E9M1_9BACT|nr:YciI family protein [Dyadobacter psychrophilus]SKB80523.1 Uncharacterized conserved protein [Dyadobacter psychrophilus]
MPTRRLFASSKTGGVFLLSFLLQTCPEKYLPAYYTIKLMMKKFLLLIREDMGRLAQMSEEEMQQDIAEMNGWVEELIKFDSFVGGEPLENESKTVGKPIATDGPIIDSKEGISGYMIIQAENLEQAAAIASQCPHIVQGKINMEVRPIMEIPQES